MSTAEIPFWDKKTLDSLSDEEWESLCDGCGRCCLQKMEDEDTGEVQFTRVSCRLLDYSTCRCTDYHNRFAKVADCLSLRPLTQQKLEWLPDSCAYKRVSKGEGLAWWHPLVSGDTETVKQAGISMSGCCISEDHVAIQDYCYHLIDRYD